MANYPFELVGSNQKSGLNLFNFWGGNPPASQEETRLNLVLQLIDQIIKGTNQSDNLQGTNGNDLLIGLGGDDRLVAGSGDDILVGGDGNNYLEGGQGRDTFVFDSAPSNQNISIISDFDAAMDTIALSKQVFQSLDLRILQADKFHTYYEKSADNQNIQGILFYFNTGELIYNSDADKVANVFAIISDPWQHKNINSSNFIVSNTSFLYDFDR